MSATILMMQATYIVPFITGPISFLCSISVIVMIVRRGTFRVREQLLISLSVLDAVSSFAFSWSTLPGYPIDSIETFHRRIGTVRTCEAQGFGEQLGVCVPLYNACLGIYYTLAVRYNISEEKIRRSVLPAMQCVVVGFSCVTSITALVLDLYNNAGVLGCWIHVVYASQSPEYAEIRGLNANYFELAFGAIPVTLAFFIVVVTMTCLFLTVRKIEQQKTKWEFRPDDAFEGNHAPKNDRRIECQTQRRYSSRSSMLSRIYPKRASHTSEALPLTKRTLETGIMYSCSFLLTYVPSFILGVSRMLGVQTDELVFHWQFLRLINVTLLPLQGFFNYLIFTSPTWTRWLRKRKWCLCCSCCSKRRERGSSLLESSEWRKVIAKAAQDAESEEIGIITIEKGNSINIEPGVDSNVNGENLEAGVASRPATVLCDTAERRAGDQTQTTKANEKYEERKEEEDIEFSSVASGCITTLQDHLFVEISRESGLTAGNKSKLDEDGANPVRAGVLEPAERSQNLQKSPQRRRRISAKSLTDNRGGRGRPRRSSLKSLGFMDEDLKFSSSEVDSQIEMDETRDTDDARSRRGSIRRSSFIDLVMGRRDSTVDRQQVLGLDLEDFQSSDDGEI